MGEAEESHAKEHDSRMGRLCGCLGDGVLCLEKGQKVFQPRRDIHHPLTRTSHIRPCGCIGGWQGKLSLQLGVTFVSNDKDIHLFPLNKIHSSLWELAIFRHQEFPSLTHMWWKVGLSIGGNLGKVESCMKRFKFSEANWWLASCLLITYSPPTLKGAAFHFKRVFII